MDSAREVRAGAGNAIGTEVLGYRREATRGPAARRLCPASDSPRPPPCLRRAGLGRGAGLDAQRPQPGSCPAVPHLWLGGGAPRGAERGRIRRTPPKGQTAGRAALAGQGRAPRRLPCEPSAGESGPRGDRERLRQLLARAQAACQGRHVPCSPPPAPGAPTPSGHSFLPASRSLGPRPPQSPDLSEPLLRCKEEITGG